MGHLRFETRIAGSLLDLAFHVLARLSFTARIVSLTRDERDAWLVWSVWLILACTRLASRRTTGLPIPSTAFSPTWVAVHPTTSLRRTCWWWMVRSKRSMGAWRSHKWGCCNGLRAVSLTCSHST